MAGLGASAAAAVYLPATFFGVGDDGYIADGKNSTFWTLDNETVPCATADVDPIGSIENLAGTTAVIKQSTALLQSTYIVNNGIKGWRSGCFTGGGQNHWMEATVDGGVPAAFTLYLVEVVVNNATGSYASAVALQPAGPGYLLAYRNGTGERDYNFYDGAQIDTLQLASGSAGAVYKVVRPDTANPSTFGADPLDQLPIATHTAVSQTTFAGPATFQLGGNSLVQTSETRQFFEFFITRALSAQEQLDFEAWLATEFGGLV